MEKLTRQEKMDLIRIMNGEGISLMRAEFEGRDVAVIVDLETSEHQISATPLAMLLDEDLFNRITPPANPIDAQETEQTRGN